MFPWYSQYLNRPKAIALQDMQGNVFTWLELKQKIDVVTHYLQQQGVKKNSGIALCGKNSFELLLFYLSAIQLGARVMGLNPAFSAQKCFEICKQNNIAYCYVEEGSWHYNSIVLKALSFPIRDRLFPILESELDIITLDSKQPSTMTLTSGSTGIPKAVVHSIQAHLDNAKGVCQLMDFQAQHSWLLSLPLYHVSGQGIIWRWLLTGATLHLAQSDFYKSLTQVTHASLVPTQAQRFLNFLAENPTQTYKTQQILLGGAMIPLNLTNALTKKGILSYTSYGMTEMASTVFAKKSDHRNGVGQPLSGREYQLIDEEIYLRGAGLALGYWKNGQIESFCNDQGWFATKDKGIWKNNELVILGRQDNMFISGGENIQPEEIEKVILQYSEVKQVFVLPMQDHEFGERPVAMIQFTTSFSENNIGKLKNWLQHKLEKFKQPIGYFPLEIEKYQQGNIKVSRQQLKKQLAQMI